MPGCEQVGCPEGFTCQADGDCGGGNLTGIALNVPTVNIGGTVTLNGKTPAVGQTCSEVNPATNAMAMVTLVENTYGYTFQLPIMCNDSAFTFSGSIYPGTYSVTVKGYGGYTNLPSGGYVASSALVVQADVSGLVLDVPTVTIAGNVTLNGATPTVGQTCSEVNPATNAMAMVTLVENTYGYSFELPIMCNDSAFTFSGSIYPGTYSVTVKGYGGYTNLPSGGFVADPALALQSNISGLTFNVPTVTLAGNVTLNGATPTVGQTCSEVNPATNAMAMVTLVENTYGYTFELPIMCNDSAFTFSGSVYPGTYSVTVKGYGGYTNLPEGGFVANPALAIQSNISALTFNVPTVTLAGNVTLNGATPTVGQTCSEVNPATNAMAMVTLVENTYGYTFELPIMCNDSAFTFSGSVYPGTYSVTAKGYSGYTNLPGGGFVANPALRVQSNESGLTLNVPTVTVAGSVTLNGATPTVGQTCSEVNPATNAMAMVTLVENTFGYTFQLPIMCNDSAFTFSGSVYPGTYSVTVKGYSGYTNLPGGGYVAEAALSVQADASGLVLDVPTVAIAGDVTLNGATPTVGQTCSEVNPATNAMAMVTLVENTYGYTFQLPIMCNDSAFTFSGSIYPGTYSVTVKGYGGYTDLPSGGYVAVEALVIPD